MISINRLPMFEFYYICMTLYPIINSSYKVVTNRSWILRSCRQICKYYTSLSICLKNNTCNSQLFTSTHIYQDVQLIIFQDDYESTWKCRTSRSSIKIYKPLHDSTAKIHRFVNSDNKNLYVYRNVIRVRRSVCIC